MTDRYPIPLRGRLRGAALLLLLAAGAACSDGTAEENPADDHGGAAEAEAHAGEAEVVRLDSVAVAVAGIQVEPVATVQTTGLPVTGTITYDANRVSHIGPRTNGRIVALSADIGERVRGGQPLAILESPEVGQLRAEDEEAEALLRIARENHEREVRLEEQGISSRKEVLQAQAELRRAEAAERSAAARLNALGAGHDNGAGSRFAVTAPFAGVVVAREANLGEMADPADRLFTVANLERLWIELDIYERDLTRISRGQSVEVSTAAYPGRVFPGEIVYVGDILDPQTRTVRARVEIPNESGALKPGMFATARIQVGGGGAPLAVVPQQAVQELEGRKVVFVPGDEPGEFRARPVELGEPADGGRVVVLSGLQGGERVVTSGAFALRSELAEGEIGEHGH
jgi:cobalt-zinc-cadmium efflux system membrane fusion protein